jgi:hypothetical protein
MVVGALVGGQTFETHLPGAWFFGMPGGLLGSWGTNASLPPWYALMATYGGLILLCRVWLGMLRQLRAHNGVPVRRVLLVVAVWAVPLLLAPPLYSRDVYSYAGQGEMVSHHISPYSYGPSVLGVTPFSTLPDTVWIDSASPYGPSFLTVDGVLADASGHRILPDIVLLRLLELAGLALAAAATPTLARSLKRDPAEAVMLGVGSPLILIALVGGAHNEALMLGLLLAGLAVAKRVGMVPGIVLCGLAAGVKSPAALGVVFLGWAWAGPGASLARRVGHTALAGVIGLATLEVVTVVSGLGWGWLSSSTTADQSFTGVTPVSAVARLVSDIGLLVHVHISVYGAHTVFSVLGLGLAGIIGLWLLLQSPERGVQRCLGLTLLILALLGPVVWAWYVTWGILILAPAASGWLRKVCIVLIIYWSFIGATQLKSLFEAIIHTNVVLDVVLLAIVAAVAIVPFGLFHEPHRPHRTASPPPSPGPAGILPA